MKNLLLIGDSIRAGYDKSVRKSLEGKVNVIFPDENCRFAAYVLRHFHEWLGGVDGKDIDVVHWNTGLWDTIRMFDEEPQTPIDVYAYYIDRICARIKTVCPNAKVIFATSTNVVQDKMANISSIYSRKNGDVEKYNEEAIKIVKKHGFEVNDLYTFSANLPEEYHSDAVHYYTPEGTKAFTNQVLSCLLPALGIDEKIEYREELHTDKPVGA